MYRNTYNKRQGQFAKSVTLGQSFAAPMPMPYRDDGLPDWDAPTMGSFVSFALENGPLKGRVVVLKRLENGMYIIAEDDSKSKHTEDRDKDKSKLEKEDPSLIQTAQQQVNHDLQEIQNASNTTNINKGNAFMRRSMRKAEVAVTNPEPKGPAGLSRRDLFRIGAATLGAKVIGDQMKEDAKDKSWKRRARKAYVSPHADSDTDMPDHDASGGAVAGQMQRQGPNRRNFLTAAGAGFGALMGRAAAQAMADRTDSPDRMGGQARRLRQSWDRTAKSNLVFPVRKGEESMVNKSSCPKCGGAMRRGECAQCGFQKSPFDIEKWKQQRAVEAGLRRERAQHQSQAELANYLTESRENDKWWARQRALHAAGKPSHHMTEEEFRAQNGAPPKGPESQIKSLVRSYVRAAVRAELQKAFEPREERVARLKRQVAEGSYESDPRNLAGAILEWNPNRSGFNAAPETEEQRAASSDRAAERREYMRQLMARKRAAARAAAAGDSAETSKALAAINSFEKTFRAFMNNTKARTR